MILNDLLTLYLDSTVSLECLSWFSSVSIAWSLLCITPISFCSSSRISCNSEPTSSKDSCNYQNIIMILSIFGKIALSGWYPCPCNSTIHTQTFLNYLIMKCFWTMDMYCVSFHDIPAELQWVIGLTDRVIHITPTPLYPHHNGIDPEIWW